MAERERTFLSNSCHQFVLNESSSSIEKVGFAVLFNEENLSACLLWLEDALSTNKRKAFLSGGRGFTHWASCNVWSLHTVAAALSHFGRKPANIHLVNWLNSWEKCKLPTVGKCAWSSSLVRFETNPMTNEYWPGKKGNLGPLVVFGDQAVRQYRGQESVGLLTRCDSAGLAAVSPPQPHAAARSAAHSFEYFLGWWGCEGG